MSEGSYDITKASKPFVVLFTIIFKIGSVLLYFFTPPPRHHSSRLFASVGGTFGSSEIVAPFISRVGEKDSALDSRSRVFVCVKWQACSKNGPISIFYAKEFALFAFTSDSCQS